MKLDRKEILKALETITIAGRKEYGGKWRGYKRSHFWRWLLLTWFCIRRRCTSRKEQK
jgi:hypothetical protein